ncbi:MAG TPA: recombinase family protein [Candidatus Magasanikbacteria bacterium]|nr:recombinase family protein [Candidatus Magasanikbacteria bacterium]
METTAQPIVRYCLYARKSTEQDEYQALSIDSQIKEMTDMAHHEGLYISEVRKEAHSAKESGQRPVFLQLLQDIKQGLFNGIIAWDPSRISRNAGDLGSVVDLMDQKLIVDIRTHGQRFTNSPNEKFLLMILCSQAKLENDHKGENVKRGLRAKCEQGWRPGLAPIGYYHDKYADKGSKRVMTDPERAPVIRKMFEKVAYENWSGRTISKWLNEQMDFTTRKGKRMTLSMIYRALKEPFYYGVFEFPVGSGKFYSGNHEPIVKKDLFDLAQANLLAPARRHPGSVEYEFTNLLYCGACGSGICAEEKFKHQQNGNTHRYVYYHCTRGKNRDCKEGAIREEELLRQILQLMDNMEFDEAILHERIRDEVLKLKKFALGVFGKESELFENLTSGDIRNYAKYILREGTKDQKRELLKCLKSKLELKEKIINLSS